MNPQFEQIGNALVQHYYGKFDVTDVTVRAQGLADLYDPENSYMTFEGVQVKGREAILQKFTSLTFRAIQRAVTKTDCQPLNDGSVLVVVLGQLKTDDDPPQSYTQTFLLRPSPAGSFYIANEIFRLVLHNMRCLQKISKSSVLLWVCTTGRTILFMLLIIHKS